MHVQVGMVCDMCDTANYCTQVNKIKYATSVRRVNIICTIALETLYFSRIRQTKIMLSAPILQNL